MTKTLFAAVAAALVMFFVTFISRVTVPVHRSEQAMLRVAFSARPERIEHCRTSSDSELADVPQHMRQGVVCEGASATYRFRVSNGDSVLDSRIVRGGGLRHDRQIYVLGEYPLAVGSSTVEVLLERIESSTEDSESTKADPSMEDSLRSRDEDARARRNADAVPARLVLREDVVAGAREVLLVTFDRDERRLALRR